MSLSGASLAAGTQCTFAVNVTGATFGVKNNSVGVTSSNAGAGNTVSATLTVVGPPSVSLAFGGT